MRKRKLLRLASILLSAVLIVSSATVTLAGTWNHSPAGWSYSENGAAMKNRWIEEGSKKYHIGPTGTMDTGWTEIDGKWYLLEPESGNMLTGWQWVEGKCYYLEARGTAEKPLGSCYINETTPDGYTVSSTGAWTVNGSEVYEAGKGISLKPSVSYSVSSSGGSGSGKSNGSGTSKTSKKNDPIVTSDGDDYIPEPEPKAKKVTSIRISEASPSEASPSDAEVEDEEFEDDIIDDTETEPVEAGPMLAFAFSTPRLMSSAPEQPYDVEWYVRYTDKDTHSMEFAAEEHGFVPDGSQIYIGFTQTIIDADGNIWTATQEPGLHTVWGPGVDIIYIEYVHTGNIPEPENPYEEAEEALAEWLDVAKEADAALMGTDTSDIPTSRILCETEAKSDLRLLSAGNAIADTDPHEIYIISKGILPTGIILKEIFGTQIVYSKDLLDTVTISDGTYKVYKFILMRSYDEDGCTHEYEIISQKDATCLTRGYIKYLCSKCGDISLKYSAATGHLDEDGDSVCDRCGYRVYEEDLGNKITTTLKAGGTTYTLTWTLVDQDYEGGCLYIADDGLPVSAIGGYGSGKEYIQTPAFEYLANDFANNHSISGSNIQVFGDDGAGAYAHILSEATALAYRDLMAAGDYVTHTGDGTSLSVLKDDSTMDMVSADDDFIIRPAMALSKPWIVEGTTQNWAVGDKLTRVIDGIEYEFTCIDDNYSDYLGNHTLSALFLCDSVIPAGYKGEYRDEVDADGHLVSVWYPGPITYFGESNDYKYSNIRLFLDAEPIFGADDLVIGTTNSYVGSTTAGRFSQTKDNELSTYSIGFQQMTARLFILSVDEALKYKNYLWKFNGSDTDNPDAVTNSTCQSYWLRSPSGTNYDYYETDLAYVVDLAQGNIHPQDIKPQGGTGDSYIDTQTTVGTRPAFILKSK